MNKLQSILAVVEEEGAASPALDRASWLARNFGARIELFTCNAEVAYALRHSYDQRGVQDAIAKLVANDMSRLDLLRHACGEDLNIAVDARCQSPLYEAIVCKVLDTQPDLVIKTSLRLDETDRQLLRACPAPLLLAGARRWREGALRIGASVDLSREESPGLPREIVKAANLLALRSGGDVEILHATPQRHDRAATRKLTRLAEEFDIAPARAHLLHGEAQLALPRFAADRHYDVIVLGALAHGQAVSSFAGSLTWQLMQAIDADFLLLKPDSFRCPVRFDEPVLAATA
jgi:universal stress protein E